MHMTRKETAGNNLQSQNSDCRRVDIINELHKTCNQPSLCGEESIYLGIPGCLQRPVQLSQVLAIESEPES